MSGDCCPLSILRLSLTATPTLPNSASPTGQLAPRILCLCLWRAAITSSLPCPPDLTWMVGNQNSSLHGGSENTLLIEPSTQPVTVYFKN